MYNAKCEEFVVTTYSTDVSMQRIGDSLVRDSHNYAPGVAVFYPPPEYTLFSQKSIFDFPISKV